MLPEPPFPERRPREYGITPRDRAVLNAIVEIYIMTGEPVSSQAVSQFFANKEGMSSATIRNVMAALGEMGWLDQPHTSAGRTPTARAFRFYVERLSEGSDEKQIALSAGIRGQIEESFAGVNSRQQFLERTSHVLALVSSGVGLAVAANIRLQTLDHIHFSRLSSGRVLAVLITQGGAVMDHVLELDRDLPLTDLEEASSYLNQNFRGWPLERARREIALRLARERSEYDRCQRSIEELCRKGALAQPGSEQPVFIEGMANLIAAEIDHGRLRHLLEALEAKEKLIELLDAYVDARQQAVRVVVGLEDELPEMQNLVLIGAPARWHAENLGIVGVLGPIRMQYRETIDAVSYIAHLSDRILQAPQ